MAKSKTKKGCFIIIPITTPMDLLDQYKDDPDHFAHVLEHLFIPALKSAGFEPISPKSTGSPVIQAEIIKQLSLCDLVLCDMSILNPNVFFEFGIRTALNKPVALVVDDKTTPIPFDTGIINYYTYDSSLTPWTLKEQIKELAGHIDDAYKKSDRRNELWKHFGVAQTGMFKPEEAELGEKVDLILKKLSAIDEMQQKRMDMLAFSDKEKHVAIRNLAQHMDWERFKQEKEFSKLHSKLLYLLDKDNFGTSQEPKAEKDKSKEPDSDNR